MVAPGAPARVRVVLADRHPSLWRRRSDHTDPTVAGPIHRRAVLPALVHGPAYPTLVLRRSSGRIAVAVVFALKLRLIPRAAQLPLRGRALYSTGNTDADLVWALRCFCQRVRIHRMDHARQRTAQR